MAYLTWTSELETGIDAIDNQHKQAVDAANTLYDAIDKNASLDTLAGIMTKITDFLVKHSRFEEKILLDHGYEYSELHKEVHDKFNNHMIELTERIHNGYEEPVVFVDEIDRFLSVHVKTHDRSLIRYVTH